eukprot:gene11510-4674_t
MRRTNKLLKFTKKQQIPRFLPKTQFLVQNNFRQFSTDDSDFHDDFKTKVKKQNPLDDLLVEVENDSKSDKIVIFMKGVPQRPECGFSKATCAVLNHYGYHYSSFNVNINPYYKEALKQYSNWPTFPQVYINGEFVGGCDIMMNLHQENELGQMLDESGAEKKE